jgi:membrane peptidoglycan carboxypeptidase
VPERVWQTDGGFMSALRTAMRYRTRRRQQRVRQGNRGQRRFMLAIMAILGSITLVGVTAVTGVVMYGIQQYQSVAVKVGPAEEVVAGFSRGGARVVDRNGVLLYEFVDQYVGLRDPIALDDVSPWTVRATIAVEDPDFWTNSGINLRGTVRAGVENFAPILVGGTEFLEGTGGSSITQQLARNVYMTREEREDRTIERKLREMVIARELTERYSKEQILEWYINLLPYGGIYVGIESASQGYFGRHASELSLSEAALLAGIPQSPATYNPLSPTNLDAGTRDLLPYGMAKIRQRAVLDLMVAAGEITADEASDAALQPLHFREARFEIVAPHFVLGRIAQEITARYGEYALYNDGLEIVTTLDLGLQAIAEEIVDRNVRDFGEQANLFNGAYIALDPHTGQILVYVGSRDYFNLDIEGNNDNIVARNSPGSTLKPFTFAAAFDRGWGTGTAILDTPLTIPDGVDGDTFTPRNPGTGFQGPVTAAVALGNSFNITAIKTMMEVGVPETIAVYKEFGYTTLDNPAGYGPALTTGGGEITLLDQAIAYSVLASGGIMRGQEVISTPEFEAGNRTLEPIAILRITDADGVVLHEFTSPQEQRVFGEAQTYLVTSILNDPQNSCITYGVCGALALPNGYPSAAKTGTSEPYETIGLIGETWTMGYTPNLVSGIWAGNANNDPIQGITSTSVSLRAWKEFMVAATEYLELPATAFERPAGVEQVQVCWPSGRLVTAACPSAKRYTSLYAAEVLPKRQSDAPHLYDSWWQTGAVDTRTGLIANNQTPAFARSQQLRLVLPAEEIREWSGLQGWLARNNVVGYAASGFGSTSAASGALIAEVQTPREGAVISGSVRISGRAASANFQSYSLQWGSSHSPETWQPISASTTPVTNGYLGSWDPRSVPDGNYTLRLLLQDQATGTQMFMVRVSVKNATAAIASPSAGGSISGTVAITGTAAAAGFVGYQVEVGQGATPTSWQSIASGSTQVQGGVLAVWDTTGLPDGPWVIRLTMVKSDGPTLVHVLHTRQVIVRQ